MNDRQGSSLFTQRFIDSGDHACGFEDMALCRMLNKAIQPQERRRRHENMGSKYPFTTCKPHFFIHL